MAATDITPVTVLTGFLGSGKTTILNHVLRDPAFAQTAVIVNEFGAVAVDHALMRRASENIVVLPGGCVCCQVTGELVEALRDLHFQRAANRIPDFHRAVIETTGLADPAPLLATLIEMPLVAARYALSGVVTTVDAQHGNRTLDAHPESVKQVALADRLVVTKSDLVPQAEVAALEARLAALNPGARRGRSVQGALEPAMLFDLGLHRRDGASPDAAGWLGSGAWRSHAPPPGARSAHDARIGSFVWSAEFPLDPDGLIAALEALLEMFGERILRMKGLASVEGLDGPLALHAVHHVLYPPARLADWPAGPDFARHPTRLVFITAGLEEAAIAQTLNAFLPRTPCNPQPTKISSPSPS